MTNQLNLYNFKDSEYIAVDIESKDPYLKEKGPGVYRDDGHICGVSFSDGEFSEYYPIDHPDLTQEESTKNLSYIIDQLSGNNRKIFANGMYDLDWLVNWGGIKVNGKFDDIQVAEPLLDEYRYSYSLNALSMEYLKDTKKYDGITDYALQQGWIKSPSQNGVKHLWKMPSSIVREYASEDAKLTYQIFMKQKELLKEQYLEDIYDIEMRLFPLLLQMRKEGVPLNMDRLYKTGIELSDLQYDLQKEINHLAEMEINVNSGKQLEQLFLKNKLKVFYGVPTELMMMKGLTRGNPKFDKKTLEKYNNPIATKILELRHITTLLNMFIHPYPELVVGEKLHCQFNPLKSDNYGTVSGRFSSSNPNLQQVSGKEEEEYIHSNSEILNGLVIRKLFIPEENCDWLKLDWNQIEYRLIAHYAFGDGAETIRKRYNEDSNVDYHAEVGVMSGIDDRKIVKTLNFGAAYGMGVRKMSQVYGWNYEEACAIYDMYHKKVPFVKETGRRVANKAKRVGFIKTLLGRRARLPSSDKAYVMFNRLIQGSAADIMKKAMVDAYEKGIFNTLIPHITVHDELDCSMPRTKEGQEAGKELKYTMENCIKLRVPIKADAEIGSNWGELKEWKE